MIYLDNGATSFRKPPEVARAVASAMARCANPGRGGYGAAMAAAETVYRCRETAGAMFDCPPERVVMTSSCTHGLNLAIRSLISPGGRVIISGFEHNAVTRTLHGLRAEVRVAGTRLFDWAETMEAWEKALREGADGAVFTHVSNVFGYRLPAGELAALCRRYDVPFIVDAAQSAGTLPISLEGWGAAYIAMPGHKGLLGPQGTGLLLCGEDGVPLLTGGTGNQSLLQEMPAELPERLEAGTLNVPGIAGLTAGMQWLRRTGTDLLARREAEEAHRCALALEKLGLRVFFGPHQGGTVSFVPEGDCEETARLLADRGIAVRAGLHCAPLAHRSAGTLETGTVRVSYGIDANQAQTDGLIRALTKKIGG